MSNTKPGTQSYRYDTAASGLVDLGRLDARNAGTVAELIRNNMSDFQEAGTVLASTWRRLKNIEKTYGNEGALYVTCVLKKDQRIVGGIGLLPFAGLSFNERKGMICDLFVEPDFRGQNLGKKLFNEAIFQARQFGYESVYLETTPEMTHAQRLFRRFGFQPIDEGDESQENKGLACYYLLPSL